MDDVFKALADASRRELLDRLRAEMLHRVGLSDLLKPATLV